MPITTLPLATVRAIGSAQVVTDSSSVVKELIDNALDAQALSIAVEISINTLDTIRVIDNGHGIAPIDRGSICRRHCTSKIASFEEISSIGGRYLGFRGEALASMVELSGGMTVTTRIEGEPTATQMEMNKLGELVTQRQVSNLVGTSICVKEFLKVIPVRREAALKGVNKTYTKIKATLQAYALARPSVRFSFRVLKAKNDKANWSYSPTPGVSLSKAALQILDQNAAKQCETRVWPPLETENAERLFIEDETQENLTTSGSLRIEALVPREDCDLAAVNHVGSFVSVDARPVSCARGTFKKVKGLYRSYLQNVQSSDSAAKLVDPILVMNVECVSGAYDPNVEPAKDDVLFVDEADFLESVETFFNQLYGELRSGNEGGSAKKPSLGQSGFDLLLSRKQKPETRNLSDAHLNQPRDPLRTEEPIERIEIPMLESIESISRSMARPSEVPFQDHGEDEMGYAHEDALFSTLRHEGDFSGSMQGSSSYKSNMYAADDDFFLPPDEPPEISDDEETDNTVVKNAQILNPWTVAKMKAPIRRREHSEPNGEAPTSFINQLPTPARQRTDAFLPMAHTNTQQKQHRISLPTPSRSQPKDSAPGWPSQSSPIQHQVSNRLRRKDDHAMQHPSVSPQRFPAQVTEQTLSGQKAQQAPRSSYQEGFISALTLPRDCNAQPQSSPHPDLPLALSYEHRKSFAASQHRAQQRLLQQRPAHAGAQNRQLDLSQDVRSTSPASSPHANRYAKAVAALHASQGEGKPPSGNASTHSPITEIALDPRDPRARLMRLQEQRKGGTNTDQPTHKLKRVKTSALPFESVPPGEEIYALTCTLDFDAMRVRELANTLDTEREEETHYSATGFSGVDDQTLSSWEAILRDAVQDLCKTSGSDEGSEFVAEDGAFKLDLRAVLRNIPDM